MNQVLAFLRDIDLNSKDLLHPESCTHTERANQATLIWLKTFTIDSGSGVGSFKNKEMRVSCIFKFKSMSGRGRSGSIMSAWLKLIALYTKSAVVASTGNF